MASSDGMDWTPTNPCQTLPQQSAPPPPTQPGFQSINDVPETVASHQPDTSHPTRMTSESLRSERPQPRDSIFDAADYLTPAWSIRPITAPNPNFDPRCPRANVGVARPPGGNTSLTGRTLFNVRLPLPRPTSSGQRIILQPVGPSQRILNRRHAPHRHWNAGPSRSLHIERSSTSIFQQMPESPSVLPRKRVIQEIQDVSAAQPVVQRDVIQELLRLEHEESMINVSGPTSSYILWVGLTQL